MRPLVAAGIIVLFSLSLSLRTDAAISLQHYRRRGGGGGRGERSGCVRWKRRTSMEDIIIALHRLHLPAGVSRCCGRIVPAPHAPCVCPDEAFPAVEGKTEPPPRIHPRSAYRSEPEQAAVRGRI